MTRRSPRLQTDRPTYEGRVLPRPDEEVVDQGLAFDLGTLLDRRRALQVLGIGAAGGVLAACGTSSGGGATATASASATASATATAGAADAADTTLTEIPDETAGPYPGDGSNGADVLEQSGVVRSDITASFGDASATAPGIPMTLTLTLLDIAGGGAPMTGAAVYVWHCDALGQYSMYSQAIVGENYLRGVQVTDDTGAVTFTSVFPGCYSGRWPHVHFEVYPSVDDITDASNAICTSQVALPKDASDAVYALDDYPGSAQNLSSMSLTGDNVFGDDGGVHQLATVTGDTSGYTVALSVPIDTATAPTAGGAPGGGQPPAPPSS
ncbi:intradiol ring-cleavage dioxygenase [Phycicoccus flavus]|uniref:Intradiol ring-cleavage dioxygenase n=1 Tax=Phycicoccus flavus TaxID=2502783 RepID=A0A8T6R4J0_9MICO|nr:intradiol ring-cleavage dioxygenase [Phycicoccus flavus]NHA68380.1 intradiol ring-cleavage dioxygenase [Phycicoccus flavus]